MQPAQKIVDHLNVVISGMKIIIAVLLPRFSLVHSVAHNV